MGPDICAVVGGPSVTETFGLLLALEQGEGNGTSPPSLGTAGCNFRVAGNASLLPPQLTSLGRARSCRRGPGDRNWGWLLVTRQPGAESLHPTSSKELRPAAPGPRCADQPQASLRVRPGAQPHPCSARGTARSIQPRHAGSQPVETSLQQGSSVSRRVARRLLVSTDRSVRFASNDAAFPRQKVEEHGAGPPPPLRSSGARACASVCCRFYFPRLSRGAACPWATPAGTREFTHAGAQDLPDSAV